MQTGVMVARTCVAASKYELTCSVRQKTLTESKGWCYLHLFQELKAAEERRKAAEEQRTMSDKIGRAHV